MCLTFSSCSLPAAPGWLAAWDLHKNWHEVFTLKTRAGEFACFDSLKAISAAWVVFCHVILWQIWFINNPEVRPHIPSTQSKLTCTLQWGAATGSGHRMIGLKQWSTC